MTAPSASPDRPGLEDASRETWFHLVLLGLLVFIAGATAMLFASAAYPCAPAAGSIVEPPLSQCTVALSPYAAAALLGLVAAILGYVRSG